MNKNILDLISERPIIFDGAMGTMLNARGVPWNACFEAANIQQPDLVKSVHLEYVAAGSQVIETNTFGANRNKLSATGLPDRVGEVNAAGVQLARSVIPHDAYLAGAVGPFGRASDGDH